MARSKSASADVDAVKETTPAKFRISGEGIPERDVEAASPAAALDAYKQALGIWHFAHEPSVARLTS